MPSLVPGYEYDIFISYRQKDNKYDGWVTEFVSNLKKELEATLKEDISIYFDENPHDGLLETHDVDESLKDKLKCLIFIPIISQTYCDPKSFAWSQEFLPFKKLASEDQFGLKVKLANGNVSSRILPVKIHELDNTDRELLDNELGPLRSVDFIFRLPGINRPLRTKDDDLKEIVHYVFYRNQINKVATAVKEIISILRIPSFDISPGDKTLTKVVKKENHRKVTILASVILGGIVALLIYFFPFHSSSPPIENANRPRIAILPFKIIGDKDAEYIANGMRESLIKHLRSNDKLFVPPSLVVNEKLAGLSFLEISERLNADFIIEASTQRWGDSISLILVLIDPRKDEVKFSYNFKSIYRNIFTMQDNVGSGISKALGAAFSDKARDKFNQSTRPNIQAYDLYLQGMEYTYKFNHTQDRDYLDTATIFFKRSIKVDPQFAEPYCELAGNYFSLDGNLDTLEFYLHKVLHIDPMNITCLHVKAEYLFHFKKDSVFSLRVADGAIRYNPYARELMLWIGWQYHYWLKDGREILALPYYLQAHNVDPNADDHLGLLTLVNIGIFFNDIGDFSRSELFFNEVMHRDSNSLGTLNRLAQLYRNSGDYDKLNSLIPEMERINGQLYTANYSHLYWKVVGQLYTGKYDGALTDCEEYMAKTKSSDGIFTMYAFLLQKNGQNEKAEQLLRDMVDKQMTRTNPDNSILSHCYAMLGEKEEALHHFEKLAFTHTYSERNPFFYSRDIMLESIWNEPEFVMRTQKEMKRLKKIRERLAKMEKEKIITIPKFITKY